MVGAPTGVVPRTSYGKTEEEETKGKEQREEIEVHNEGSDQLIGTGVGKFSLVTR